jgi:hypothetical protein
LDSQVSSLSSQNEMIAFMGWIADRIEAAKVQQLYRK